MDRRGEAKKKLKTIINEINHKYFIKSKQGF